MALAKNISTGQADRYYDKDDYYTEDAAAPSHWHGRGAEALGLSGPVKSEDFKRLVRGELPDGTSLHRGGSNSRRAGTDFEFSAPKSFSIQALVVGDARLVRLHQQAVAVARHRIEEVTATRVTRDGKTVVEQTGTAVMAEFLHTTSRAGDPDLHSHVVALNLTRRADGQWRSVDNTAMYREQRLMYEIYLSELAKGARQLGYRIAAGKHGNPELAHITREQIEHFSSRGAAVEAALYEKGLSRETASSAQKAVATMATRSAKQDYNREQLTQDWRARAGAMGVDMSVPKGGNGLGPKAPDPGQFAERRAARDEIGFALAHLGEREAAFERKEVMVVALRASRGVAGYSALEAELSRRQKRGEVLPSRDKQRVTTLKALEIERRILAIERYGRSQVAPVASLDEVARHLAGRELTVGQAQGVQLAATTGNAVAGIQGLAGTGKTTALRTFQEIAQQQGYQVLGLAPSHSAVKALNESGIGTRTLQSWLSDRQAIESLSSRTIVVVDEAGLVGNRYLLSTLQRAKEHGARVLLVGDTKQYQSVTAGRAFSQLQRHGMETAHMTEILRQRDGRLARAARLSVDEPAHALSHLEVREIADAEARYAGIAQDYAGLDQSERSSTLILTGTNQARTALNQAVRHVLQQQGELAGSRVSVQIFQRKDATEAEQKRLDSYEVGDALRFQKAYRSLGVSRGEIFRVVAVTDDQLVARNEAGKAIAIHPASLSGKGVSLGRIETREITAGDVLRITGTDREAELRNGERAVVDSIAGDAFVLKMRDGQLRSLSSGGVLPLEYGYAATGHSAQGLGANRVLLDRDTQARTTDHRSFYTDLTRARNAAVIYTNDRKALPQAVLRQSEKTAALDVVGNQQHRDRRRTTEQAVTTPHSQQARRAPGAQQASGRN